MVIRIRDGLRVRKTDPLNNVIEVRHVAGPKAQRPGEVTWKPWSGGAYYGTLKAALRALVTRGVELDDTEYTLAGAIARIEEIQDEVVAQVEALRG